MKITDAKQDKRQNLIAVAFQTGRHYSEIGQPIIAMVHQSDTGGSLGIVFCDYARGIDGYIPWFGKFDIPSDLANAVMFCYDRGSYTHDHTGIRNALRMVEDPSKIPSSNPVTLTEGA